VLALLSDGQPHDHHSLYALNVIAHSRVSDLRKRGHTIEMWREDDLYFYRLIPSSAGTETATPSPEYVVDVKAVGNGNPPSPCPPALVEPVQLRLIAA
jgi:hypothetical protein